jgi:hypothetical protein
LSIRRLKLRSNLTPYLRWHLVNEILDTRHFQRLIDLGTTIGALAHLTASRDAGQANHESGQSNRFHLSILLAPRSEPEPTFSLPRRAFLVGLIKANQFSDSSSVSG